MLIVKVPNQCKEKVDIYGENEMKSERPRTTYWIELK